MYAIIARVIIFIKLAVINIRCLLITVCNNIAIPNDPMGINIMLSPHPNASVTMRLFLLKDNLDIRYPGRKKIYAKVRNK